MAKLVERIFLPLSQSRGRANYEHTFGVDAIQFLIAFAEDGLEFLNCDGDLIPRLDDACGVPESSAGV